MSLKRRDSQAPESGEKQPHSAGERQKSVIVYILLLFLVAFLLMGFSLLTHQRNNMEALGQLNDSIAAMKDAQNAQDQVILLQNQLDEAREAAAAFEDASETVREQAAQLEHHLERTLEAAEWFWQLDEAYLLGDMERCGEILAEMKRNPEDLLETYLPEQAAARYVEIAAKLGKPDSN